MVQTTGARKHNRLKRWIFTRVPEARITSPGHKALIYWNSFALWKTASAGRFKRE
jgi:hypothetical protein